MPPSLPEKILNPDFLDMLSALSKEGVEFLLIGGHAVAAHGYIRATKDLDLLIHPTADNAARVMRALQRFGAPLFDVSESDFTNPEVVFQIGLPPRRIDLLTTIPGVEFEAAWSERLMARIGDLEIPVLGRSDLIRNKRTVGRLQDLADVDKLETLS